MSFRSSYLTLQKYLKNILIKIYIILCFCSAGTWDCKSIQILFSKYFKWYLMFLLGRYLGLQKIFKYCFQNISKNIWCFCSAGTWDCKKQETTTAPWSSSLEVRFISNLLPYQKLYKHAWKGVGGYTCFALLIFAKFVW